MKTLDEIQRMIGNEKQKLSKDFHVKAIGIFGSYVRGEQHDESDIDLLVDLDDGVTLLDLIGLQLHLEEILTQKVDVVMRDGLKPRIASRILDEVMYF